MKSVAPLPTSRNRFGTEHSQAADTFPADYLVFLLHQRWRQEHSGIGPFGATVATPSGTCATKTCGGCANAARKRVSMPVSVEPGTTAFTRIPELATSRAIELVMPSPAYLAPTLIEATAAPSCP